MSIEELVDQIDDVLDQAVTLPLSGGKLLVDGELVRRILDDIRLNLPKDIRQAERIVADRTQIISDAKREAETTIRVAEERAKIMVSKDEIVRQATDRANDLLTQAKMKSSEMRKAANDYVDDLMQRTDEAIAMNLAELRKARQGIKASHQRTDVPTTK